MKYLLKYSLISITIFGFMLNANCQIPKKGIVEHFTNSNCGICASVNPGFYSLLNPNILHVAYFPSSPYSTCFFSVQNTFENDERTKLYNIFGSTPRFVFNGTSVSFSNLATSINNQSTSTSNFSLKTTNTKFGIDSFKVIVTIKKIAIDTTKKATFFVGVKEDTVFRTTGNGEKIHPNVFRKALTNIKGEIINLPVNINDSVLFIYVYKAGSLWDINRLNSYSLLQNVTNKVVIQSAETKKIKVVLSAKKFKKETILFYPNPAKNEIFIDNAVKVISYEIVSLNGKLLQNKTVVKSNTIPTEKLKNGLYQVVVYTNTNRYVLPLEINN